jgi:signal transduction histidine kinase
MNMRTFLVPALFCLAAGIQAQDHAAAAKALVKEAVAYGKANGLPALLKEVNNGQGKYHVQSGDDLYVFVYDDKGTCIAIGFQGSLVGVNRINTKDPDGKLFIQEIIKTGLTKAGGWVDYKYPNPKTGKVMQKTSYVESLDGKIVGCGIYK